MRAPLLHVGAAVTRKPLGIVRDAVCDGRAARNVGEQGYRCRLLTIRPEAPL